MAENQTLLVQLQRQNARIQGLLTPSLKQTAGAEPFAGRKFQVAARKMRVLTADGPGFTNRGQVTSLSSEVVHRFQNVEAGLHINPKMLQTKNKTWDGVERVFHGSGTVQAKRESTPAMPGEMRQGSIIPRMETFPKPGQSVDAFRQQIDSAPRPSRTPEAPKKAVIAPKARLFTKVEEISRQPAKTTPPAVDEPDLPALSLRSPPPAPSDEPIQRKIEQVAPPTIQRSLDLPDSPMPSVTAKDEPESGKSDFSPSQITSALQDLPATVARKAETALPPQPKPSAPDVALPVTPVARLPLQDQLLKTPAAKAVQRKETASGETPAQQNIASEPPFGQPAAVTPPVASAQVQRAPIASEQETFAAVDMPGALPTENKESKPDEPILQAKLIQPKPFAPASDKKVVLPAATPSAASLPGPTMDAPKAPIAQAKPVQRQFSRPLQAQPVQTKVVQTKASESESVKPVSPASAPAAASVAAIPVQGSSPSAEVPVQLVQRASSNKDEDIVEQATSTIVTSSSQPVSPSATPAAESAPTATQAQPPSSETPGKPMAESDEPLLQAKLVQRQSIEPAQPGILRRQVVSREPKPTALVKPPLIQAKQVSRPMPLATKNRILPSQPDAVQRVVASNQATEKAGSVQRTEIKNLPISPVAAPGNADQAAPTGLPSISRLVDKPEGFSPGNSLIRRMPLVEKIQARPRVESLLRSADSEPSSAKISPSVMLQRQPSALIQPEKYQSVAMPAVLPDMTLPGSQVFTPATSAGPSPMTLARKVEAGPSTAAQFAEPVQQAAVAVAGSENAFSGLAQRTIENSAIQDQPSLAAGNTTGQAQPGDAAKDKAKPADLNALAEDIFPIVKRLLAIEADRSGGGFR